MMNTSKVTAGHLRRDAWLYVRQSTLRQVFENQESTRRQYALRDRAVALGWPIERIHTIDCDLGESGASQDREGFRQLTTEVAMGGAGIVLGLEVSRLARNSSDWHRLLEFCALSDTLILDEDGIYNPSDFNDRLLLGLKGTMSEAELHVLRSRLRGGILNKARRGELKTPLPVGLIYDPLDRVALDPDVQVRESVQCLFDTFRRTGSATATVRHFRQENILFPARGRGAPQKGPVFWQPLTHSRALKMLHNPRYAGAFVFGRSVVRRSPDGSASRVRVAQDEWPFLIRDAHPGYIDWDCFEANQAQLRANGQAYGADRRSPPREGPALLQGIILCGCCGERMTVRYHQRGGNRVPDYLCQKIGIETATSVCQRIPGTGIDHDIGQLLIELVTPATLEMALRVQEEIAHRAEQADAMRARQVQRAREESEIARQRFMRVHPDNRLVADTLEAEWNETLRAYRAAQQEYEKQCATDGRELNDEQRQKILDLATDFPRLWNDPETPHRERKRMVRLLIEDVTISSNDHTTLTLGVRLRAGATRTLTLAREPPAHLKYRTPETVVAEIDTLLEEHLDSEIADILNQRGHRSGHDLAFNARSVLRIRRGYKLKSRFQRLRERGYLTLRETAETLGISPYTVKKRRRAGLICGYRVNDKNECLYQLPVSSNETATQPA